MGKSPEHWRGKTLTLLVSYRRQWADSEPRSSHLKRKDNKICQEKEVQTRVITMQAGKREC